MGGFELGCGRYGGRSAPDEHPSTSQPTASALRPSPAQPLILPRIDRIVQSEREACHVLAEATHALHFQAIAGNRVHEIVQENASFYRGARVRPPLVTLRAALA